MLYVTVNIFHGFLHSFSHFIPAIFLQSRINPTLKKGEHSLEKCLILWIFPYYTFLPYISTKKKNGVWHIDGG